jgi:(1->4)-alpha-D-glucan 1-alpha-D-glucosylmutase
MRILVATYRLQFNGHFTLAHARDLLGYLRALGISDIYASPLFLATPESAHGYDVCSFEEINPSIGSKEELERIAAELRAVGMGLLLDIVPNHMGTHPSNCWWQDVLRHGAKSKFANYFDINWHSAVPGLKGKVLLPVLGDHYAKALERGELQVATEGDAVHLAYFAHKFPLAPESIEKFGLKRPVEPLLRRLNGKPGDPASFNDLHALIEMQNYRLAYWRVGPQEINYRRFFDVTALVSVRVEEEEVFHAAHRFVFDLLQAGTITGLRIDHPDGLRDPERYLQRLQENAGSKTYVVVEKILSADERLPEKWPVSGTTGYDYLNYLNGIFIRQDNADRFTGIYHQFTGSLESYETIAYRSKQEVLNRLFVSEVNALTARLKNIAAQSRYGADLAEAQLRTAIVDFIAGFPVYRNYVTEEDQELSAKELSYIEEGCATANRHSSLSDKEALKFLARVLSLECFPDFSESLCGEAREFAIRFQQLSGPATAKGLEDTAFYRYTRFVSLNEVGGEPRRFGQSLEEFHAYNRHKAEQWPHSMLATSTHDTKRGEDVRARLNVLSEIPDEWQKAVNRWRDLNASLKTHGAPTPNDEYLLYQTLVGTWVETSDLPGYTKRIQEYMLKAMREAKAATSWTDPNEEYESAVTEFIGRLMASSRFIDELSTFVEPIAFFGMFNSLAQVVIKTCSPGVPDFYQGTELWDLSLVDPDNRRPVEYRLRKKLLGEVQEKSPRELLQNWKSGAVKMFTMLSALRARHQYREIFEGDYRPLSITGPRDKHVIAFRRTAKSGSIVVAVPRFLCTLTGGKLAYPEPGWWGETSVSFSGAWRFKNLFTNETQTALGCADLFRTFPAAILLALD